MIDTLHDNWALEHRAFFNFCTNKNVTPWVKNLSYQLFFLIIVFGFSKLIYIPLFTFIYKDHLESFISHIRENCPIQKGHLLNGAPSYYKDIIETGLLIK